MPTIGGPVYGGNINGQALQAKAKHPVPAALRGYTVITLYEHLDDANGQGDHDRLMQSIWLKNIKKGYPVYTCPFADGGSCTPSSHASATSSKR